MYSSPLLTILRKNIIFIFLLIILSIGIYANSLLNDFAIVDDLHGFIENPKIREIWPSIKTFHIQNIVYALTYNIFGIQALPLRIVAVINHAFAGVLLFLIIDALFNKKVAYIAALLFAVHPVNTETVNWVSAQFYIVMTIFQFCAILSHIAYRKTHNKKFVYLTAAIITVYLVLFQHPWVLAAPLVIVVIDFFILNKGLDLKFHKLFWLLLLPVLFLYFIIRFPQTYAERMDGQSRQDGKILLNEQALIPILEGYPYSVYNTFRLYGFPKDLTIYYDGKPLTSLDRLLMFLTFILYIAGCIYAYYHNKKIAGLLLLLVVCIAPVFSPIKVTWYITERYLYFGTGFFTALLALLFIQLEKKFSIKHLAYTLTTVVLILFSFRTWIRNTDWRNPETLAFATMKTSPQSVRPLNDVAGHYVMSGRIAEGKEFYKKALSINPSSVAMNNLGYIYMLHDLDPAIRTLDQPKADIMELGNQSMQKKEFRLALYYYNEIYTPTTQDVSLLNSIAAALLELDSYDLAEKYLTRSLALDTTIADTYFFYGYLSFKKGETKEAIDYLNTVLRLDPTHAGARTNLDFLRQQSSTTAPSPALQNPVQK